MNVRVIDVKLDERVETGRTQIGDDWPGVFIRGDNAFHYALRLRQLLDGNEDMFTKSALESLYNVLKGCEVR